MVRRARLIFWTAFVVCLLSPAPSWAEGSVPKSERKPFLWKVKSATSTVYLLGSIHVANKDMYPLHEKIQSAFKESDRLVVEVDAEKDGPIKAGLKMQMKGRLPPGESLFKHIDKDVADLLKTYAKDKGLPLAMFQSLKPWFAGLMITMLEIQRLGLETDLGIDKHFVTQARGKKPILELETFDGQLKLFDGQTAKIQNLFLKSAIVEAKKLKPQMDKMVAAWLRADTKLLETLLMEGFKDYPDLQPLRKKIFDDRNVKMTEKVIGYLKGKGTYFVIAGAGHMVSKMGIVELLRAKGYKVEKQ